MSKRLTKIQASARGEMCTFIMRGCRADVDTVVLCHWTAAIDCNSPRKSDYRAAYGCVNCHDIIDGRTPYEWRPFERAAIWAGAIAKTHVRLIEKGLLTFEGIEPGLPKTLPRR